MQYLTEQEVFTLIKQVDSARDRAVFELLYSSGLRISELLALPREPFIQAVAGKTLELSIVGKGKKRRTVYCSPRALVAVKQWLKEAPVHERLFPYTARAMQYMMKRYDGKLHPHVLRHSYATSLLNKGVDIRVVQRFCGHSRISSTEIYTHVTDYQLRNLHEKLFT